MKLTKTTMMTTVALMVAAVLLPSGAANAATPSTDDRIASQVKATALEVYAEVSTAADPEGAYAGLSKDDRAAFDAYFLPTTTTAAVNLTKTDSRGVAIGGQVEFNSQSAAMAAVAASTTCWIGTSKLTAHAALGNAIWDTWTEGKWCGNGSSVSSAAFTRSWSTIAAVGWRDGGQIDSGSGIAGGQARMWSQRKMIFGTGGWDVQTQQPCNRLNGNANGSVSQTGSCSIV